MVLWQPFQQQQKTEQQQKQQQQQMGQFASSTGAEKAASATTTTVDEHGIEVRAERAPRRSSLIRPSQPIDIRRGPTAAIGVRQHPPPQQQQSRVLQRCASEMAPKLTMSVHHQAKVIQPQRLASASGSSAGPSNVGHIHRQHQQHNHAQHGPRRPRGFTVDIPVVHVLDPDCPSSSSAVGGNKENGKQQLQQQQPSSGRGRRKRQNSAGLEQRYNEQVATSVNGEVIQKNAEVENGQPMMSDNTAEGDQAEQAVSAPIDQQQQQQNVRRRPEGGRIAYLYGVYGAPPESQKSMAPLHQHGYGAQRNALADQVNMLSAYTTCWDDEDCCCFEEDPDEEDGEELDELARTPHCLVHSLHTVSDIIGYAKVVRAQRNETLGRLNDVMSQFDALIRSYSMAMKSAKQQRSQNNSPAETPAVGNTTDGPCQTQLEESAQ